MVSKTNKDGLLTTTQVGKLLNLHANTVRRWSDNGILKAYRIGSRDDRRFRYEDVMRVLKMGQQRSDRQNQFRGWWK